ncbi:unnamed protein product [Merluccius merluccius]
MKDWVWSHRDSEQQLHVTVTRLYSVDISEFNCRSTANAPISDFNFIGAFGPQARTSLQYSTCLAHSVAPHILSLSHQDDGFKGLRSGPGARASGPDRALGPSRVRDRALGLLFPQVL